MLKGEREMGMMICPKCGKEFDDMYYMCGENGNPICPECFMEEPNETGVINDNDKQPFNWDEID